MSSSNQVNVLTVPQVKLVKRLTNPFTFIVFTLWKVPMLAITGVRLTTLNLQKSQTSIPFKYLNINPFKSMYFAVQAMAAELSTAALAMLALKSFKEDFAFIVVGMNAEFVKKATQKVYFECQDYSLFVSQLEQALETQQPVVVESTAVGKMTDGTTVAKFHFKWSFKPRKKRKA